MADTAFHPGIDFAALASRARVLHRARSPQNSVVIRECDGLRWLTLDGDLVQSLMLVDAPTRLVLPHHLAMLLALLWCPQPRRVLNLGFGGGAFERFFAAQLPACVLESVEINSRLVELARRFFALAALPAIHVADAADYVASAAPGFDLALCDLFTDETHPDCLFDPYFYADLRRCIAPHGALALNTAPIAPTIALA